MNATHARRWLKAAAACDPSGSYAGPLALIDALAGAPVAWQGAVSGGDPSALRLIARPTAEIGAAFRASAAAVLGLPSVGPAKGADWLDAAWDARNGAWTAARAGAPKGKSGPFKASAFAAPVGEALARFHALCPVAEARRDGDRWSLSLVRPLAWPLLLRCDLSAAFAPRSSQLSLLLRDARVEALDFDGEALWARFS